MSSEVAHEPAASRPALSLDQGVDKLASLLNAEPAAQPEPEAAPAPAEPAEETPIPETQEAAQDVAERPEAEEAPTKEEATEEVAAEEVAAKSDEESTGDEPKELELQPEQLAALLGFDEGDLEVDDSGSVSVKVKVDGAIESVPLREIREGYRLAKISDQRISKLGEDRKTFDAERQQAFQHLSDQMQVVHSTLQTVESEYASDFNAVDWERLKQEDPTEHNLKRLEYEDRARRLQRHKAGLMQQSEEFKRGHAEHVQRQHAEGRQKLQEVFHGESYRRAPKWDDAESKRLSEWIVAQGIPAEALASVTAWQPFKWARDSMLREEERKQAKATIKKVAKLPKIVKPGTPKPASERKRGKLESLKQRQRKAGGTMDASMQLIRGILDS